ncbi:MAG: hypothetical protein C4526_05530 [Nitrospiraceae bacterium]|nr:MAG: hypothetical protein C4526_05530 [Nitrospiraceae bacterium]
MDVQDKLKGNIPALLDAAQQSSVKGDYDGAIAIWKKILTVREDANIYNTIGDLHIKKGAQNEAVEYFTLAADRFKADGFHQKAMAIYKKILNIVPFEINAIDSLGDLYAEKGLAVNAVAYYLKAAEKLSRDGETDKAIDVFNKILHLTPSDVNIKTRLSDLWLSKGLPEKAASIYAGIAADYMEKDELDSSIEFFSKAIGADPRNIASFTGLSSLAEKRGNLEQALDFANKALDYSGNSQDILSKYVHLAIKAGKAAEAENTLSELIMSSPDDAFYKKLLSDIYISEGRTDKAWETLQPFIDELLQDQNWDEAYELLPQFRESFPIPVKQRLITIYRGRDDKESLGGELNELAVMCEEQGLFQNALGLYRELTELQPGDDAVKNKIDELEIYLELKLAPGSLRTSLEENEIAIEGPAGDLPPDDYQDKRTEAEFYANQGLLKEALGIYEEILSGDPDNVDIRNRAEGLRSLTAAGEEALSGGETKENDIDYEAGPAENDYESHYNAGIEYRQKGLLDDAIREFKIVAKDPEKAVLSTKMIALCYMEKGAFINAIEELNTLLQVMPLDEERCLDIKYELAGAHMKNNDYGKSLEIFAEILTTAPDYRDVSHKMDILRDLIGKSEGKQKPKKNRISYI